jgi:D-alanyl-D-alanine carboxypeptidase
MLALMTAVLPRAANAESALLIDADSGKVLHAENATYPWYPASLTKLMTIYTTLTAIKQGRITLDTMVTVSALASSQAPSKMGFQPGTQLTLNNAMTMMMVKSANDMAVVLAEGVDGSVEKFADEMNANAQRLGMTQTHFDNPNGLPDDQHYTSARDLALLAQAIFRDLPEYTYFVHIPGMKFGRRITRNFNPLLGRFPGADGMKTGFICSSGYNLIASAQRDGHRLIAVVLGAPSSAARTAKAATMLDAGFSTSPLDWLKPSLGNVKDLAPIDAPPADLHDDICGPKHKHVLAAESDDDSNSTSGDNGFAMFSTGLPAGKQLSDLLSEPGPIDPVVVYVGPKKTDAEIAAAAALPVAVPKAKRSAAKKATQVATASATKPATDAKPAAAKPVVADAKPKASDKPKTSAAQGTSAKGSAATNAPAAKPAAPKTKKSADTNTATPSKS